jgi:uncharacterized membrane protein YgcG
VNRAAKLAVTGLVAAVVVVVPVVAGVASSTPPRDDAFTIDRFDREVVLEADGRLEVTETIDVTFHEPRRGIFRDLEPDGPTGDVVYHVDTVDRGDPSQPWNWLPETSPGGDLRLRIGDADVTLDPGPQTYRLRYEIAGLVFRPADRPEQVQIRVDVPGDAWPVDVAETTLTVQLPAAPSSVACVVGSAGDDTPCPDAVTSGSTVVQTLPPLGPSETGTVAVEVPVAAVNASLPTAEVQELTTRGAGRAPFEVPAVPGILATTLLVAAPALLLEWFRSRVVYRDRVTDAAVHDRIAPTAELSPPDGLAPTELAAVDRVGGFLATSTSDLLLGTLIDLQIRGVVTSSGGGSDDEPLTFAPGPTSDHVRPWEGEMLGQLLPGGQQLTYDGEYDRATATRTSAATSVLTRYAGRLFQPGSRYVHTGGGALRSSGYGLGIAASLVVGGLVGLVAMIAFGVPPLAVFLLWGLLAVAWIVLTLVWREERRPLTSEGRDVIARTRAFERFLEEVHADRLDYAGGRDDIEVTHPAVAMLPYAVVLGLGASWLERFEPLLTEASRRGQAGAVSGRDPWFFHPAGYAAVSTLHRSSTTDPSSSSGGGGFGGGGAGSGGGGGGGGSW